MPTTNRSPEPVRSYSGWAVVLAVLAVGCWLLAMSMIGFDKPERNSMDAVSSAAYNHQQNVLWAEHLLWICALPVLGAIIGAVTAGLSSHPNSASRTALRTATGAFIGSLGSLIAVLVLFVQAAASSTWQF